MIELKAPVKIQDLDNYLGIAAFVDKHLPKVKYGRCGAMYQILEIVPDINEHSYYHKQPIKITPTSRQIAIYDFVAVAMLKATPEDRLLIYKRNFPRRKSFRQIKREGWLHWSHTTIAHKYKLALSTVCSIINKHGINYFK